MPLPNSPFDVQPVISDSHAASRNSRHVAWLVEGIETPYGVWRMVWSLAQGVRQRGWQSRLVSLSDGPIVDAWRAQGWPADVLDLPPVPRFGGGPIAKLRRLAENRRYQAECLGPLLTSLERAGVNSLHVIRQYLMPLAGRAARRLGIPCTWELSDCVGGWSNLGLNRLFYQWTCHRLRIQPLAISHFQARTLGSRPVAPVVLPLSVDLDQFDPQQNDYISRDTLGVPLEAVVFAIAARLHPDKGQDRFLQAMLDAQQDSAAPLHLVLLGGPTNSDYARRMQQIAAEKGASKQLHLVGEVHDPQRYYAAVDIAVNSRVDAEPFGLSVVEAMAMRRPVLVHALGGPAETVVDGSTGWHVRRPTVEAFRRAIERALTDRPRWPAMGDAARRRVEQHYTLQDRTTRYMALTEQRIEST